MFTVTEQLTNTTYNFAFLSDALDFCDDVMESYWGGYVDKVDLKLFENGKELAHKVLD